jgi:hypothetical protein
MKIFAAANDAGGAEVLSEYLLFKKIKFSGIFTGPAHEIFRRKFCENVISSEAGDLRASEKLIVATSANSMTELSQIRIARQYGITSIALIDGAGNIKNRFEREGVITLPDKFIVDSMEAKKELEECFGAKKIVVGENYYLNKFKKIKNITQNIVLYLTDPISEHGLKYFNDPNYYGFSEYEAVELFLENYRKIINNDQKIVIRPHPDESENKYSYLLTKFSHLQIDIDHKNDLENQISAATMVIGCSNNAMIAALMANKRVISILPSRINSYGIHHDKFELIKF